MIVKDVATIVTWTLSTSAVAYVETYFDLTVTDPDGLVVRTEGGLWADTFQAPTTTVAGFITDAMTFTKEGLYTLTLSTGAAGSYTVLAERLVLVVSAEATIGIAANLA